MRTRLFIAVSAFSVSLIGSGFAHSKQATKPKTPPPKPPPLTQTVTFKDNGVVTASYIRMHHPEAVLHLAKLVQSGKGSKRSLDALASPSMQSALFTTPIPNSKTKPEKKVAGARHIASAWGVVANPLNSVHPIDYSPTALKFPNSWDQQTVRTTLHVTSNTDGPVTATLSKDSPFTITSMTIYDGSVTWGVGLVHQQPIAFRKIEAQTTHAPWSIETNAGQDVDIELAYSPKFNLNTYKAGLRKDTLVVKGTYWNQNDPTEKPWKIDVPVSGDFKGIQVDVQMQADQQDVVFITPPAYDPKILQTFEVTATLINVGQDVSGTIVGNDLQSGLSMAPVPIYLAKGKTTKVTLVYSIDPESILYLTLANGQQTPIGAKLELPGKSSAISMDMTSFLGIHDWDYQGSGAGVDYYSDFEMLSTGDFTYNISGYNNNWFWSDEVDVDGTFNGVQYIDLGVTASNLSNFSDFYGFNRLEFQADYVQFVNTPLQLTIRISSN